MQPADFMNGDHRRHSGYGGSHWPHYAERETHRASLAGYGEGYRGDEWGFTRDYYRGEPSGDGWEFGRGDRGPNHRGKGPKGYTRSDERLKEMVCEALADHHEVDASDIEVSVKDGEVTLTGIVDTRDTKRLAERVVEHVGGVVDVHNQLRLKKSEPVKAVSPQNRPH